jgi:hypothetical protein
MIRASVMTHTPEVGGLHASDDPQISDGPHKSAMTRKSVTADPVAGPFRKQDSARLGRLMARDPQIRDGPRTSDGPARAGDPR